MEDRILNLIENYNLTSVEASYKAFRNRMDTAKVKKVIGIFGQCADISELFGCMFGYDILGYLLVNTNVRISVKYGLENSYEVSGVKKTKEAFLSALDSAVPDKDYIVFLNSDILRNVEFILSDYDSIDDQLLLITDLACICISAAKSFSKSDRMLMLSPLLECKKYFLCGLDKLNTDADREAVKGLFNNKVSSIGYIMDKPSLDIKQLMQDLLFEILFYDKKDKIEAYYKSLIQSELNIRRAKLQQSKNVYDGIIVKLENVKKELNISVDQTFSYFQTQFIDKIKLECLDASLAFFDKMKTNIEIGVEEEENLSALKEQLPNYVLGEWTDFADNKLTAVINDKVNLIAPSVCNHIQANINRLLKSYLDENEYESLGFIVSKDKEKSKYGDNNFNLAKQFLDTNEKLEYKKIVSNLLMIGGGIILLGVSIFPGLVLLCSGNLEKRLFLNDLKKDLIESGKKLNIDVFDNVKENVDEELDFISSNVKKSIEIYYNKSFDNIIGTINGFNDKSNNIASDIDFIASDIKNL